MMNIKKRREEFSIIQYMMQTEAIINEYIYQKGNKIDKNLTEFLIINTKQNILDSLSKHPKKLEIFTMRKLTS
jgi:hypothetical protein